jgi:hypothetical protein
MSAMKQLDTELAEEIAKMMRRFEAGWLEGEMFGYEMLVEMKKFVDDRAWILKQGKPNEY